MIILLGDTVAAEGIGKRLLDKGFRFKRFKSWPVPETIHNTAVIIDAIHPSRNTNTLTTQWCETQQIPYIRLERPEIRVPSSPFIYPVFSWEDALHRLERCVNNIAQKKGRPATVFATTGSYQLESIVRNLSNRDARLVVRVLPEGRLVQKCQDLGIAPKDICAMQGPFSKEINKALLKFYSVDILLTRDSGRIGGTDTKMAAAIQMEIETILIKKNLTGKVQTASNVKEILIWLESLKLDGNEVKESHEGLEFKEDI